MKSIKNTTTSKGMANAHKRDGSCITRYFAWLNKELVLDNSNIE